MTRALLLMTLVVGCRTTPPPPAQPMSCTFKTPAGWSINPAPLPDHVLEAHGPTMGADVISEVSAHAHLEAALGASQRWLRDARGTQPGFFAEANENRGDGITSRTWWGDPKQLHVLFVRVMLGRVIVMHVRGMKNGDALDELLLMLEYLRCTPNA
ncbi:MAG: hypothetical protein DI536_02075 [Archangium gephyra]|uniref:Uncharacterized protein n=1 Tax=Archangium gephyra TaxID=48 RepID=A0A2W5W668_9BACT|nr:MAG: hypothetical protein DI536_02075 [Archangium gephyra]